MKHTLLKICCLLLLAAMLLPLVIACKPAAPTMSIGPNGNWFLDGADTGIPASGQNGDKITIGDNGNWFINGKDTGVSVSGKNGTDGANMTIGDNGNWFLNGQDTGISATPKNGTLISIGQNGNWFLDGVDSGTPATGPQGPTGAQGPQGPAGADGGKGTVITIGENGNWFLDGVDSGLTALGENGTAGADGTQITIGSNGNWFFDGVDSGVPAKGQNGTAGTPGAPGKNGTKITIGENGNWFLDGVDSGIPATGTLPPATPEDPLPSDDFKATFRFLVTSDLHLRTTSNDYQSYNILKQLIASAYSYSETQLYNKLDGMFFAGDFTQNGAATELEKFFDCIDANTKEETTVRAILGNHEYWESGKYYRDTTKEEPHRYGPKSIAATEGKMHTYGGEAYAEVDVHLVIGGYHFIALNMDMYDGSEALATKYSPKKLAWLEAELAKADADDPTGKKPIFVFHHMPATDTVNETGAHTPDGNRKSSDDNLGDIFENYPQVVDFAGHTHCPITDPRSIWQGGYTAINTASLAYLGVNIANHPDYDKKNVVAMDNNGGWAYGDIETSVRNAALFYFVELNNKHEIRLVVYNLMTKSVLMTIDLGGVGDPSTYTYTKNRKLRSEAPVFPAGAKLELLSSSITGASLVIPQASCPDTVNNYRCEIYENGRLVKSVYRLACQYLGNATPSTIALPITGLTPGTTYTVKVVPVNTWGIEGKALETSFSTTALAELKADLFSIAFNADGSAVNTLTGKPLAVTGTPTVTTDATLNKSVGVFDGSSAYRFMEMASLYPLMANAFTFETYVYVDSAPSSSYVDLVSNQQGGGFGFELKSNNGKIHFYCHDGSGYKTPAQTMPIGQWVHLVGVFDGTSVTLYLNGVATSVSSGATMQPPPAAAAQYLCIGGDSNEGLGSNFMIGKIATVNLYSFALNAQMVKELYAQY